MINFYKCKDLKVTEEYWSNLGLEVYMRQPNCIIFQADEGQIGFIQDLNYVPLSYSCISFVVSSKEEVDALYQQHQKEALAPPQVHPTAPVYSFFMKDPNGLTVEYQVFIERGISNET